ncbi:MAG: S8 family serine peptidase [Paracoccaceae bacterium]
MTDFIDGIVEAPIVWDNYLDHENERLSDPAPSTWRYEPLLVGVSGKGARLKTALTALRDAIGVTVDGVAGLLITPQEAAFLDGLIANTAGQKGAEVFIYRHVSPDHGTMGGLPSGVRVLDVGLPVDIAAGAEVAADGVSGAVTESTSDVPIVAVIDDGIGFLNERFRMRRGAAVRTRFDAVWLQAPETGTGTPVSGINLGKVLDAGEINAHLSNIATLDEAEVYRSLNAAIYPLGCRRATDISASHGTQVMDIAAGCPQEQAGENDPLLMAVHLPPRAIGDTSGARFEAYVLKGLRWILARAALRHPTRPVVINLSVGMLAGPKDGSHILESQIERELTLWEGRTGRRARLVLAFGNGYRNRQVARTTIAAGETVTLGWRVQPDDRTANHLEIYGEGVESLDMALADPRGQVLDFPAGNTLVQGASTGGTVRKTATAALYRIAAQRIDTARPSAPRLAASIAATTPHDSSQTAAIAGLWQITLTNTGTAPQDIRLEIQRDDRVAGPNTGARQSFFDGPGLEGEDPLFRDWNALPMTTPVTEGGSHSALAGCLAQQVHTVGALMRSILRPAPYCAAGHADGPVVAPSLSGVSDEGVIQRGIMAAGTLSGATRMLNGTSAASPMVVQALTHCAALRLPPSGDPVADRAEEVQQMAASPDRLLWLVPQDMRPRLGEMTMNPPLSRRPRRMTENPGDMVS